MLAAGHVEEVKSALSRLVTRIEVHEDPRPGWKRAGAKLVLRGNLEAMLQLTGKVTTGGSSGGVLPVRNGSLPQAEEVTRLTRRMRKGRNAAVAIGTAAQG